MTFPCISNDARPQDSVCAMPDTVETTAAQVNDENSTFVILASLFLYISMLTEQDGVRLSGDSYLVYQNEEGQLKSLRVTLVFRFDSSQVDGSVLFISQRVDGSGDVLYVTLENATIVAYAKTGRNVITIR